MECPAAAKAGVTNAPMPNTADEVPPGAPTVDNAGPAFPADATKITPCLLTISSANRTNLPAFDVAVASP